MAPDVNRLIRDVEDAIRGGLDALNSLQSWVNEHGNVDQREYAKERRWAFERGLSSAGKLRQLVDQLQRGSVVIACDHDSPDQELRCRCQDPGANPPCSFCTDPPAAGSPNTATDDDHEGGR